MLGIQLSQATIRYAIKNSSKTIIKIGIHTLSVTAEMQVSIHLSNEFINYNMVKTDKVLLLIAISTTKEPISTFLLPLTAK